MLVPLLIALAPDACSNAEIQAKPAIDSSAAPTADYVIHEWGTFTSVSDDQGKPMRWRPLLGRSDLPPFVYEIREEAKSRTVALVRMETPVIYFYAKAPLTVSVDVQFPQGEFTEWYPSAEVNAYHPSAIRWPAVRVGAAGEPPASQVQSHYLPAREVASELLAVGEERERFLFYRGVATFEPTRSFRLSGDQVEAVGSADRPYIVYRREGDRSGFTMVKGDKDVDLPVYDGGDVREALTQLLIGAGLYPDEATAMIRSWEGDWFEPGLRVFWLYTGAETDAVLPLTLNPAPQERVRVLVGRTELIPYDYREEALAMALREPDREHLHAALNARFGRFAVPVARLASQSGAPGSEALYAASILSSSLLAVDVVD